MSKMAELSIIYNATLNLLQKQPVLPSKTELVRIIGRISRQEQIPLSVVEINFLMDELLKVKDYN